MTDNSDNIYKTSSDPAIKQEIHADLEKNMEKFKDPIVLGELMYKLLEERENTNRILKNILAKLDSLEAKGDVVQTEHLPHSEELLLPEIDGQITSFVNEMGKATAEDVRSKFNYKGTNAASARLNRLFELGVLEKKQVGKKVFFLPKR